MSVPVGPGDEAPYPLPSNRAWQERWIEAVLATEGANVPRAALENIAPFIVRPKALVTRAGSGGGLRLRPDLIAQVSTDSGLMLVLEVRMHGAGGVVWPANERISTAWHSVAHLSGTQGRTLASVRPWRRISMDGEERSFAALESAAPSRKWLADNIEWAANELRNRDGARSHNLLEELALHGQQEPGMFVPQYHRLDAPAAEHGDGYWGWMAVRGNNRTMRRQELFGITSAQVLTGVPFATLGQYHKPGVAVNPHYWLGALSRKLNDEYQEAARSGAADPMAPALRARQVAEVQAHLVIGCPTPERLYSIVQGSNRRDHVHPPLEFAPNDRARALGRNVLGAYAAAGVLDTGLADVLAGTAPIAALPEALSRLDQDSLAFRLPELPEHSVSTLRDARSMLLLAELFPGDGSGSKAKRELIRHALSEVAPGSLQLTDINRRARAWSALTSQSYPYPWNPRVAEIFQRDARKGFELSGRPLTELLKAADTDDAAFEELVTFRAAHWLAAFDLIDADRGSLAGQIDEEGGTKSNRVRRSVKNVLNALRHNRIMAVGLLRELAAAMDAGDRAPRRILPTGEPEPESDPANHAWFNRAFPKATGGQSHQRSTPPPEDTAEPVLETDAQAVARLTKAVEALVRDLADSSKDISACLRELAARAKDAGIDCALSESKADELVLSVSKTLGGLRLVPETLTGLSQPD
ncbi:hypothetical protein J7E96_03615 [Streptomyces sp. ISL-96]|uniref:hypothetical protein n=1 Tax=Streptomyces sp. ISL-96 TaxID=2819191 RepID=UPI001BEAC58D|nr:hypothetical protein [Streptomyces sp. ISL-96]MBT2487636.1 hypothetical protein [Streptomyces sp. ISL-96]